MNIEKITSWLKFLAKKYCMNGLKGIYAEKIVSGYLNIFFPRAKKLNNVTLPYGNYTSQIDHILINEYGIFVIEVKNYKGFITATQFHEKWFIRYFLSKNAKTYQINSPYHQNITHCKAVASVLGLPHAEPINVVSFTKRANIKIAKGECLPNICVGRDVIDFIKSFTVPRYTSDQVEEFNQRLWANRLAPSLSTDYFHINNIKQMMLDLEEDRLERERQKVRDINQDVREQANSERLHNLRNQYSDSKKLLQSKSVSKVSVDKFTL
ncbi:NERD domain-containing protein [Acinetobacter indicus]|uniref:nuclease-related domain-containing protein n=1 Tax=Acinetobacter TaxID=469 RepID=UPI0015D3EF7F|nr:NERD domain-containing protein [Acinetobacter indicus]